MNYNKIKTQMIIIKFNNFKFSFIDSFFSHQIQSLLDMLIDVNV